jgi:hypothetical protein
MSGYLDLFQRRQVLEDFLFQDIQLPPQDPHFIGDVDALFFRRLEELGDLLLELNNVSLELQV